MLKEKFLKMSVVFLLIINCTLIWNKTPIYAINPTTKTSSTPGCSVSQTLLRFVDLTIIRNKLQKFLKSHTNCIMTLPEILETYSSEHSVKEYFSNYQNFLKVVKYYDTIRTNFLNGFNTKLSPDNKKLVATEMVRMIISIDYSNNLQFSNTILKVLREHQITNIYVKIPDPKVQSTYFTFEIVFLLAQKINSDDKCLLTEVVNINWNNTENVECISIKF